MLRLRHRYATLALVLIRPADVPVACAEEKNITFTGADIRALGQCTTCEKPVASSQSRYEAALRLVTKWSHSLCNLPASCSPRNVTLPPSHSRVGKCTKCYSSCRWVWSLITLPSNSMSWLSEISLALMTTTRWSGLWMTQVWLGSDRSNNRLLVCMHAHFFGFFLFQSGATMAFGSALVSKFSRVPIGKARRLTFCPGSRQRQRR